MPREKESYRDNLELLVNEFPHKKILTIAEIARFWGKDYKTVKKVLKDFIIPHAGVSIAVVARKMS